MAKNNEDDDFPKKINGIYFATKQDYDDRVEQDTNALAHLLYGIYKDKKAKDQNEA